MKYQNKYSVIVELCQYDTNDESSLIKSFFEIYSKTPDEGLSHANFCETVAVSHL